MVPALAFTETPRAGAVTPSQDALLTVLLAQLPVGVIIASDDGSFKLVNEVACKLFAEHARAHGEAESWVAPVKSESHVLAPIQWILARVLLTGEIVRAEEVEYLDARDEWRTLRVDATPLARAGGEIGQALVTFVDVTDVKRAREWEPLMRAISRL